MSIEVNTQVQTNVVKDGILSTLIGFTIFVSLLSGISIYVEESLFFAIGIGGTALFSQLARHFKTRSLPWWCLWAASLTWLTVSLINIDMFVTK